MKVAIIQKTVSKGRLPSMYMKWAVILDQRLPCGVSEVRIGQFGLLLRCFLTPLDTPLLKFERSLAK